MDIKHFFEKLKSVFTSDKKLAVLCAVGVLGVVLLIISEFIPSGEKKTEKKESVTAAQSQETYAEDIEKRLTEIVSSIDGAGKTRVMVTLESGAEQVYAKNEKIKSDTSGGTALEKENFSDEKEYVLIETDGNEGGMIIKLIQPKIRGVAVVCEGGGSDAVRQEITQEIIAAALVLALGSAVFINWYYNRPSVKSANAKPSVEAVDNTGGNLGDAQLVNSSGVSESAVTTGKSSDYFASAKLRRNSAHDEASETLNKVIKDSSSDASAVKEATEALKALSNAIKLEGDIEALIKAKTGGDCVVIINNNSAEVIVAKGALNDTVILQIKEIVLKQTGFSAENITIVELSS